MRPENKDIVIVGGGIMGSALAYCLMKADPRLRLAVVERDPTYSRASTTLSLANVRVQFSFSPNIQISQYTLEVLERFAEEMAVDGVRPNVGFRSEGNLFLVAPSTREAAEGSLALQQRLGCAVSWWRAEEIRERFPLYDPAGLAGGTFGARDGHLDAHAMLMAYRAKARALGAAYLNDEVLAVSTDPRRVEGVRLASGRRLAAPVVVNCAGAWAAKLAAGAGVKLPIDPVKRQVFALRPAVKPKAPLPLTVLSSGLYFRTETGGLILVGKSLPDDPTGFDFTWDDQRFQDLLWPELAAFVPVFERLKLLRGWAGLYAVNRLDGNAILGEWPELKGFYLANGFSGHGLQQAPAVGRYMAERILSLPPTLDLSVFGPERILQQRPLAETGLV